MGSFLMDIEYSSAQNMLYVIHGAVEIGSQPGCVYESELDSKLALSAIRA